MADPIGRPAFICKNCKYASDAKVPKCLRPTGRINLITGEPDTASYTCAEQRDVTGVCGATGLYYEPKGK